MSPRPAAELRGKRRLQVLLTCEHGGNAVPVEYRRLFRNRKKLLESHRGLDIGALAAARDLQRSLDVPLIHATVTRLLVDLNRSSGHPALFSEVTRPLPDSVRRQLLAQHYHPYRRRVRDWIARRIGHGDRVLHLSVHSFTPVLDGKPRNAEIGFLYDPASPAEAGLCRAWQKALSAGTANWRVRRNYPYRGTSDGQVVELRRRFCGQGYLGVEVEFNQAIVKLPGLRRLLVADLAATLPV